PREVERVDDEEERGDDGPGAAVERLAEGIDEPRAERRRGGERQDEAGLVQAEETAGEGDREQPGEAVCLVVWQDRLGDEDGVHLAPEDEVVAETEAAEPEEAEPEPGRHEREQAEPVAAVEEARRARRRGGRRRRGRPGERRARHGTTSGDAVPIVQRGKG